MGPDATGMRKQQSIMARHDQRGLRAAQLGGKLEFGVGSPRVPHPLYQTLIVMGVSDLKFSIPLICRANDMGGGVFCVIPLGEP